MNRLQQTPTVLAFDCDDTLWAPLCKPPSNTPGCWSYSSGHELSASAELALTKLEYEGVRITLDKRPSLLIPIAQEQFKKIFNMIYEIGQTYGENSPISIKIITTGTYEEDLIREIFNKFYADGKKKFTEQNFPMEVFNRHNFLNQGEAYDPEKSELNKGKLISENYARWKEEMPGLEKKNIYLVDNSNPNINEVEECGFSALYFPTTTYSRPISAKFSEDGPFVFAMLHLLIKGATGEYAIEELPREVLNDESPLLPVIEDKDPSCCLPCSNQ